MLPLIPAAATLAAGAGGAAAASAPAWLGGALGAAGSVLGGLFGSKGQSDANAQNAALQREFAKNGIRWRVADAKKAGIHKMYAVGAQPTQAQASFVNPNQGLGQAAEAIGQLGSDISAPATKGMTPYEIASIMNLNAQTSEINSRVKNEDFERKVKLMRMMKLFPPGSAGHIKINPISSNIHDLKPAPGVFRDIHGKQHNLPKGTQAQIMSDWFGEIIGEGTGMSYGADQLFNQVMEEMFPPYPSRPKKSKGWHPNPHFN
ncbi:DNA pilot protein [Microviridae sp.]|nr:DNA pilot protein [Microviridae sp.]